MAILHTGQWVKFFQQAGIPDKAAATYALTFAENRIQLNMLLDLNKEYLRDMGIIRLGDIIAILRHAKHQHEEMAREKLLVRDQPTVSSKAVEVVNNIPKSTLPAKIPSAQRTIDHVSRESLSVVVAPKPKVSMKESDVHHDTHPRKLSVPQPAFAVPVKRKCKPTISTLETITIEDDITPKKPRRVSPEEEGGYKIKMPSGSTPRSQEILAKSKELARRKTVFQRLGSGTSSSPSGTRSPPSTSAVSSTTGVSTPSFKVIGLTAEIRKKNSHSEPAPQMRSPSSSVFRRLGDKQVSSSTPSVTKREVLPYAGILKSPDKFTQRIVQKPVEKVTMVADSVETLRTEVRERLGNSRKASLVSFFQKDKLKDVLKSGVKSRLGGAKLASDFPEQESSVRERLKMPQSKITARTAPYTSPSTAPNKIKEKSRGVFSRLGS